MSHQILAIDIQKKRVCSVLLSHGFKGGHTIDSLLMPIDETGDADFFSCLQTILAQISDTMGNTFDKCIIGIPADYFLFRTLAFPFKSRKKIEQIIDVELENYLPCAGGDFKTDFSPLAGDAVEGCRVSTASIEKKHLERFSGIFDQSGLNPDTLTIGSGYASAVSLAHGTAPGETIVFVHLEPELMVFFALKDGGIFFIRASGAKTGDPETTLLDFLFATCLAVTEMEDGADITKIFLSDVENAYQDMTQAVEEKTGIPVGYLDVLPAVEENHLARFFDSGEEKKAQNAAAIGVCDARGIEIYNFHRKVSELAIFFQDYKSSLVLTFCLMVCALLVWGSVPLMRINAAEKEIAALDSQIREVFHATFPGVDNIVAPVQQMQAKLDAVRKKRSVAFLNDHVLNIELLNQISNALPPSQDIIFTRFVRTENSLMVAGSADQFKTVDRMKSHLHAIPFFREVEINSASMDKLMNRVKFSMKILF